MKTIRENQTVGSSVMAKEGQLAMAKIQEKEALLAEDYVFNSQKQSSIF